MHKIREMHTKEELILGIKEKSRQLFTNQISIAWNAASGGSLGEQSIHNIASGRYKEGLIFASLATASIGVATWRYALRLKELKRTQKKVKS